MNPNVHQYLGILVGLAYNEIILTYRPGLIYAWCSLVSRFESR